MANPKVYYAHLKLHFCITRSSAYVVQLRFDTWHVEVVQARAAINQGNPTTKLPYSVSIDDTWLHCGQSRSQ